MKIKKNIGIAIFAYNRPSHLRRVFIALEDYKIKNSINVFLDGPKKKEDKILQNEIKFLIKTNSKLKLKLTCSKKNQGIKKSLNKNIDHLSKIYDYLIVLEDDTIPRRNFFNFIEKMIKYNYSNDIAAVCGYQLPKIHKHQSKIINFIKLDNFIPWGWVVKSSYWKNYRKLTRKKKKINDKNLKSILIKRILKRIKNKKSKIWSVDFMIYNSINKKKYLYPSKSLIKNIGLDGSGMNCAISDKFTTHHTYSKRIEYKTILKNKNFQYIQQKSLSNLYKYFY